MFVPRRGAPVVSPTWVLEVAAITGEIMSACKCDPDSIQAPTFEAGAFRMRTRVTGPYLEKMAGK